VRSPTHPPVEDDIQEASSSTETTESSSSDDSQSESFPETEEESTPIADLPDLRTPAMVAQVSHPGIACPFPPRVQEPAEEREQLRNNNFGRSTEFPNPLNQWNRSDVVSRFKLRIDGHFEVKICTGTKVDPRELSCLTKSELPGKIDGGGERERNKLALHFAVLFQDLHWVESLVNVGYSPNLSARISDIEPLPGLHTPIAIAIASHCEPITKVLLKHGAELNPTAGDSPCLQLFAATSLNLWPSTILDSYMRVLRLLLTSGFVWPRSYSTSYSKLYSKSSLVHSGSKTTWTLFVLHQICDLPEAWFHLRKPLIIYVLKVIGRNYPFPRNHPALQVAMKLQDLKTIKYVLEISNSQDLNIQARGNEYRWQPLRCAIEEVTGPSKPSLDIVRALLERGASPDNTFMGPMKRTGSFLWKKTTIRELAMRSDRDDLKKLISEY
jgi:ankyrin repeat protein